MKRRIFPECQIVRTRAALQERYKAVQPQPELRSVIFVRCFAHIEGSIDTNCAGRRILAASNVLLALLLDEILDTKEANNGGH